MTDPKLRFDRVPDPEQIAYIVHAGDLLVGCVAKLGGRWLAIVPSAVYLGNAEGKLARFRSRKHAAEVLADFVLSLPVRDYDRMMHVANQGGGKGSDHADGV